MAISRADLEAMDRDQLVQVVLELDRRLEDVEERVSEDFENAAKDRADIRTTLSGEVDRLESDAKTTADQLHRERGKLARRVAALEEEIGVTTTDALATAEAGPDGEHLTKLGRLVRHGPEAVSDQPGATLFRARELVENWNRWGTVKDDELGKARRLASKKHRLKTHLEDARDESLSWRQVYRAMEWVGENGGPNVTLTEGSADEGKHVLVHRLEGDR